MNFYKKITASALLIASLCGTTQSHAMFDRDSLKATAAKFMHQHPIVTALVPNTIVFSTLGLLKNKPFKRFGLFLSSTTIGAFFSQHLGHNYLRRNFIRHNPKALSSDCSFGCLPEATPSLNQNITNFFKKHI